MESIKYCRRYLSLNFKQKYPESRIAKKIGILFFKFN